MDKMTKELLDLLTGDDEVIIWRYGPNHEILPYVMTDERKRAVRRLREQLARKQKPVTTPLLPTKV